MSGAEAAAPPGGASPHLSLIVPAYNEAGRIGAGLERTLAFLRRQPRTFELLVVDDGSRDETADLVRAFSAGEPRVRLLSHAPNRGKGFAIRQGMLQAEGAYRAFMDADLSVPVETLAEMVARLEEGFDVVVGSRQIPGSRVEIHQPSHREFMGQVYTRLANRILGLAASDFTCGFKGFRRAAAEAIFSRLKLNGWSFDAEILYLAHRQRHRILELPVTWRNDGATRVRLARDVCWAFWELLRIRLCERRGGYR
jgi:glycosyltransferase involved in cell wall biosynthesis